MQYTTHGSVRGGCGHRHQTLGAAERCLAKDARGCSSQGGYSDRSIVGIGDDGYLYSIEEGGHRGDWIPAEGGRTNGAARFAAR